MVSNSDIRLENTQSQPSAQRRAWIDIAKGFGIILVVAGHALGGVIDDPKLTGPTLLRWAFLCIYTFHMPLFFFLSGIFIEGRTTKSANKFIDSIFNKTLRAYFIWSIVQFTIIYLLGSSLNHPVTEAFAPRIVSILWNPVSQYWFLYSLILVQISALIVVPRFGGLLFFVLTLALRLGLEIFGLPKIEIFSLSIDTNTAAIGEFCTFAVWFGLGVCVGPRLLTWRLQMSTLIRSELAALVGWITMTAAAASTLSSGAQTLWPNTIQGAAIANIANGVSFAPAAALGSLTILLLSMSLQGSAARATAYLGRHSMAIFLLHVLFVAGTRVILSRLLPQIDTISLLVVSTIFGVIFPLFAFKIAERLNLVKLLALM